MEYKYSVDMLKIRRITEKKYIEKFMNKYRNDGSVEYWFESGIGKFKHNFKFKQDNKNSFWVGIEPNSPNIKNNKLKTHIYLRFNPNKIKMEGKLKDIFYKLFRGRDFEIVSADIAADLFNIDLNLDVIVDKQKKHQIKDIKFNNSNRTYYIGRSGRNGSVRLYDKKKELEDNGKEVKYDYWTRYEVTINPKVHISELKKYKFQGTLPKIYIIENFNYDDKLSKTDWCILQGLVDNSFKLSDLGRGKRKKIKSALNKQTEFKADSSKLSATLKKYVYDDLLSDV